MQKIMLTVLFCSVVTMANSEQNSENGMTNILSKTLTEVKKFKKEKNQEIQALRLEISLLKSKLSSTKNKEKKAKVKLELAKKKNLKYKRSQIQVNKKLKENKKIIKDLHFMLKQKDKVSMDEYALGRYYFNL